MPFINSKLSVKVSDEKKEAIKTKLGHAIEAIPQNGKLADGRI